MPNIKDNFGVDAAPRVRASLVRAVSALLAVLLGLYFIFLTTFPISDALASGITFPAYGTIQSGGSAVAQQQTMNFIFSAGAGSAVNNAGSHRTDITITGATTGSVSTGVTLTANLPVIGAGGSAIAIGTRSGNTTGYANFTGSLGGAPAGVCTDGSGNLTTTACPTSGASISIGTLASRPAFSGQAAGTTYYTTDAFYTYVSDGSAWQPFFRGFNVAEPLTSVFTAAGCGSGSPTVNTAHGGIIFTMQGFGSDCINYRAKSLANSAPYTLIVGMNAPQLQSTNNFYGLALRESSTGKAAIVGGRTVNYPSIVKSSSNTGWVGFCNGNSIGNQGPDVWIKITVDGSGNINFSTASDPFNFAIQTVCATTIGATFTTAPDSWGVAVESEDANTAQNISFIDFKELSGIH